MTSATQDTGAYATSAQLAQQVAVAIEAVRMADCSDCGRRRDDAVRLVHRWVAQQERDDVAMTVRALDAWAVMLNAASGRSGSARPVVRRGLRLTAP